MRSRRHSKATLLRDYHLFAELCRHGLNFIKLDGDIGCLGAYDQVISPIQHVNPFQSMVPGSPWPRWIS